MSFEQISMLIYLCFLIVFTLLSHLLFKVLNQIYFHYCLENKDLFLSCSQSDHLVTTHLHLNLISLFDQDLQLICLLYRHMLITQPLILSNNHQSDTV
jgi:hypothetical protein